MKKVVLLVSSVAVAMFLVGCQSVPPGAERGPNGTIAYIVSVEASQPGAKIEVNGQLVGDAPVQIKIFGDKDGTFHDFGSDYYVVKALPVTTNQFAQARYFGTGRWFGPEDRIPDKIYFDMNQPPPQPPAGYAYPPPRYYYYGPPVYYGPPYPYYYGPRYYYRHHW